MADENNQESIVSHLSADTDSSAVAIHHTLGPLPFQASPGSHVHDGKDSHRIDYNSLLNLPEPGEAATFTSTVKHRVLNGSGSALTAGQVVYITGADGTNMLVGLADADSDATSATTIGLLEDDIAIDAHGYVVTEGLLAGINTTGATAGDPVWLSSTPGAKLYGLANKPKAPVHLVYLGVVTRVNSNNGEIFVSVNNGWELDELHDVKIVDVAAGEVIQRTSSNLWENKTLSEAGISAVGHTHDDRYYTETEITSLLSGKSDTGHTHTGVYSPVGHSHEIADVNGLATVLSDKADEVHTHAISDVTGLQTSLDDKALAEGYTANRVIVSNGAGAISASTTIDTTELGYLNGVTDNIQTQLTAKANKSGYTASRVLISDSTGNVAVSPLISTTELDYLDNLTDNVQSQLNGKSATGHTHIIAEVTGLSSALSDKASLTHTHAISDVTGLQAELDEKALAEGYTADRVIVSNGAGAIAVSPTITTTELGYLNGVTDNIQTQLTAKANKSGYTASRVLISDSTGNVAVSSLISTTELDYLDNLTDNVQSQLNGKSATGHTHAISDVTGLSSALAGKASTTHTHAISDVTGLQTALDDKAAVDGYTASRVLVSNSLGAITASTTIDTTELGYLNGVTSGIQAQLDGKDVKELYRFETADNLIMSSVGSATTASVFGTNGVAVEASTAYLVEGVIYFTAGVVGTSATHIINWGSPSGAATVTRNTWLWDYNSSTTALNLAAAMTGVRRAGTTSFAALNTITMTGTHLFRGQFYGIVEFNAAGNFTPRITVTPTSASVDLTINTGSYIKLQKLGTTNTNGTWS